MSDVILLLSLFKNSSTSVIVSSSVVLKLCCPIKHKLNYKQIMEMQTQDKPYSCGQCNLSFKMNKDIRTHMIEHDGTKPHSCNQCGYWSVNASHLKSHMLVHIGKSSFVCKQCSFSCTTAGNLKTHMLTHSGYKPFNCKSANTPAQQNWEPQDTYTNPFRK